MPELNLKQVEKFISENIGSFHETRLQKLQKLKLKVILKRKNPYLFKCKNVFVASDLVRPILDAYLSSQEETIFGDFLEQIAIYVNAMVFGGRKSTSEGIDLEFDRNGTRFIVAIKSGPNWANANQKKKMRDQFLTSKRALRTGGNRNAKIVAINGCCYGKDSRPDKGDYFKYCGQDFWEFISGDKDLYIKIIDPLGTKAKEKNEVFNEEYGRVVNKFTKEFSEEFCVDDAIDWEKLIQFNSGNNKIKNF